MERKSGVIPTILKYAIMLLMLMITVYPVIWMVLGSLKDNSEFYNNIWGISASPQFQNYSQAWVDAKLSTKYFNSILNLILFLAIMLPVNTCASYAVARLNFRFKKAIYAYLLAGIMIPSGVLAIPTFSVLMRFGLVNTRFGLVLVCVAQSIAFGMFIMRSFFISLPKGLEEAAMIDGCSRFKSFIFIILPLALPGLMTQIIYNGLTFWNEYLMSSVILRSEELYTLPLGLAVFMGQHNINYPELFAVLVCSTMPMILLYLAGQKTFMEGITAGSIKG